MNDNPPHISQPTGDAGEKTLWDTHQRHLDNDTFQVRDQLLIIELKKNYCNKIIVLENHLCGSATNQHKHTFKIFAEHVYFRRVSATTKT